MSCASLPQWLARLERLHPKEIDLGLERIRQVAERLSLTRPRARVVTIAGTNGKGSSAAATAALLRSAGRRVGLYTSPHLNHYCERIVVDGLAASEAEVCDAFQAVDAAREGVSLTYFEFGTLAALLIFSRADVDYMVLEVGLGGRLDAVNLLDADLAVITAIDLDHQAWLGETREAIGREKAGVLRAGRPAVCADPQPPESVTAAARGLGAPLSLFGRDFGVEQAAGQWWFSGRDAAGQPLRLGPLATPALPLPSVAAAIEALCRLGEPVSLDSAAAACRLELAGRGQRLAWCGRTVLLDVAHNPAAARHLAGRLEALEGRVLAVAAMLADKAHRDTLAPLAGRVEGWYLAELNDVARAAPPRLLAEALPAGSAERGCGTVGQMLNAALADSRPGDTLLVFGSFHTVGEALAHCSASASEERTAP